MTISRLPAIGGPAGYELAVPETRDTRMRLLTVSTRYANNVKGSAVQHIRKNRVIRAKYTMKGTQ